MLFFGLIANKSLAEYQRGWEEIDEANYRNDLMEQCYVNASIAQRKFTNVRAALFLWSSSFLPLVIFIQFSYKGLIDG